MIQGRRTSLLVALLLLCVSFHAQAVEHESMPGEFVVKVKDSKIMSLADFAQQLGANKVSAIGKNSNLFLVKQPLVVAQSFALQQLKQNANVVFAEPNYIYRINIVPNDPQLGELWGLNNVAQKGGRSGVDIGATAAWDIQTGSDKVLVAVIDTGVDYTHPDLVENIWTNEVEANGTAGVDDDKNGYVDDIHGYDFANHDGDPMDDHGHGTHVSGTIGAKGDDGKGIVGVNWHVKIMGLKFLTAEGSGTLADAVLAINYATEMGAVIQSNSWGGGGFSQALFDAIVLAEQKDSLFVAAAGNSASNTDDSPMYPVSYEVPNIIGVAAINNSGQLADFSSYGMKAVQVAAPGVDIYSSLPFKLYPSGYEAWSGTSMATPHVSGIAALLKAQNFNFHYADIKKAIVNGVVKVGGLRNKVTSGGMVNAYYALTGETAPIDPNDPYNWQKIGKSISTEHPYKEKGVVEFEVKVDGANEVAVYFERFETESGYDFAEFYDAQNNLLGKWSGTHSGEISPSAKGDTIKIIFRADDSVQGYGFDITQAAYR